MSSASVQVDGEVTGSVAGGLVVLLGVGEDDSEHDAAWMARKCAELRIFRDEEGRMNRSVEDVGGGVLAISQFTLFGNCTKGRRPSFTGAAPPERAQPLYDEFVRCLRDRGLHVGTGVFQAMMDVSLVNDGPVTLILDSRDWKGRPSAG